MSPFWEVVKLWMPFLFLIGLWLYFMWQMVGKSSWSNKWLEHLRAQTEAQQRIAAELIRIATALEQRK